MKITSYDSQGNVTKDIKVDDFVPQYIKSFDPCRSVLTLYYNIKPDRCERGDAFSNCMNAMTAEKLLDIDYSNFLQSAFSHLLSIDEVEGNVVFQIPEFDNCDNENKKLMEIINFYGGKSRMQIEEALKKGKHQDLVCLSDSTWILSLADYAKKKADKYINRVGSKVLAFKVALQTVINKYFLALKNMNYYKPCDRIWQQLEILEPFVSKNAFRVERQDIEVYHTSKFFQKLVNHLYKNIIDRRNESYCFLQMLRGDYQSASTTNSNSQLLYLEVSHTKAPNTTHTFTIREYNGDHTVINITDREMMSLLDNKSVGSSCDILIQTFQKIYDGYKTSTYKQIWDNQIEQSKFAVSQPYMRPEKIQTWSYMFFDELSNYSKISIDESYKEQMCFYKLIYSYVRVTKPKEIIFDGFLIHCFFNMLKMNNCQDQIGFFEKIYTLNEILANADFEDIALMNRISNWNQIEDYKKSIETIDEMISFLEPILNSSYVNETDISIDNLKKMIRNILKHDKFITMLQVKRPQQLLKQMDYKYNCNIALLLNIIGTLYVHVFTYKKIKLFKSKRTLAFHELVRLYPKVKKQSNDFKYLTECHDFSSSWSELTGVKEQIIVDEASKPDYY